MGIETERSTAMNRHFIRHYIEMLIAMGIGMVVLGIPAIAALSAAGTSSSELRADAPAQGRSQALVFKTGRPEQPSGWMVRFHRRSVGRLAPAATSPARRRS
jgi:hypothetical protein